MMRTPAIKTLALTLAAGAMLLGSRADADCTTKFTANPPTNYRWVVFGTRIRDATWVAYIDFCGGTHDTSTSYNFAHCKLAFNDRAYFDTLHTPNDYQRFDRLAMDQASLRFTTSQVTYTDETWGGASTVSYTCDTTNILHGIDGGIILEAYTFALWFAPS
jgi:hypothetical protein